MSSQTKLFLLTVGVTVFLTVALQNQDWQILKRSLREKGRIVNGENSTTGQYPWVVSLREGDEHFSYAVCGGSLITPSIILTAAHCVGGIRMADYNRFDQRDDVGVQRRYFNDSSIVVHENYSPETFQYDVALIHLDIPFEQPQIIVKINADPDFPQTRSLKLLVVGWGRTSYNGEVSNTQQFARLDYIPNDECLKRWQGNYITGDMLCAYGEGTDACQGDSGGPILTLNRAFEQVLVGVVSFGKECASDLPGVYARVSFVMEWLEEKICGPQGLSTIDCDGDSLKIIHKNVASA